MILKLKKFIMWIIYFLILLYLLIFIPKIFGYTPLVVVSGSMEPTLKVGGLLYYEETENLNKNDILVYKYKNHIISHRIVEKLDDGFITRGDANDSIDSNRVSNSQVLGKGTNWSIPYLGYYADFIYSNKYLFLIAIILVLIDLNFERKKIK